MNPSSHASSPFCFLGALFPRPPRRITSRSSRDPQGKLQRFAIAGEDKKWVWANAVIDGQTVVCSSLEVPKPLAVRYAFAQNPEGCNLYNNEGLPASPFRTDEW